ncbi:MAG: sigma-70 family RNA polymerase sigma factor [Opitutae bacterium]|nr:sigma-70 family RNA polymerase sigma factor [Opitutae bacterium]
MPTDAELLSRYTRLRDQHAFAELVERHLSLVYGAALRRMSGRPDLAEEIAQRVFADLARKTGELARHPTLAGWLHQATRYAAIDALRDEARRAKLARQFAAETEAEVSPDWERLRPVLDEAMDRLAPRDRDLVLLRFFEGLTHTEVGARLGLNENAARMRAERALEKLRGHRGRRGVTSTSAALGLVLTNQPAVAVPVGLAGTIAQAMAAIVPLASAVPSVLVGKLAYFVLGAAMTGGAALWMWPELGGRFRQRMTAEAVGGAKQPVAVGEKRPSNQAEEPREAAARAEKLAQKLEQHRAGRAASTEAEIGIPSTHRRDHGQDTPRDAILSLAWAQGEGEMDALARLICFEDDDEKFARELWRGMPDDFREQFDTTEKLYALLLAADALTAPPPPETVFARFTQLSRGDNEVELVPPGFQAQGMFRFRRTEQGWKWILPKPAVHDLPRQIMRDALAAKPAGG